MFWTRFLELCSKKGEYPNAVAAKCGVKSKGTVTGWKNGAVPRPSILLALADYFGVTVAYLTGEDEKKPTPINGDELTDAHREAIEIIKKLSPAQVQVMVASLKATLEK